MPLPSPFRPPVSIAKYNGETKPKPWLADFRLACQLGGARGDNRTIIRQLLLFLSDTARRWLEELPANQIHDWTDLVRVFKGNFKGTYIRPDNSWDLSKGKQRSGESLRGYARRFSKQRTSFHTSPTMTSFWLLSQAPHARTWCENWVETDLRPSTN